MAFRNINAFIAMPADLRVDYAASPQTYSLRYVRDPSPVFEEQVFGPADITNTTMFNVFYSKTGAGGERESFDRSNLGLSGTEYVVAGRWQSISAPKVSGQETSTTEVTRTFVYGNPTQLSDVPRQGTLSYNYRGFAFAISGQESRGFQLLPGSPPEMITINFNTGQMTGTINTTAACSSGLVPCGSLRLTGNFTPSSNRIEGTISEDGSRFSGTLTGATFGPGSREIGIVLVLQGPEGRRVVAHLLGRAAQ